MEFVISMLVATVGISDGFGTEEKTARRLIFKDVRVEVEEPIIFFNLHCFLKGGKVLTALSDVKENC